jgi:hypothetical protein
MVMSLSFLVSFVSIPPVSSPSHLDYFCSGAYSGDSFVLQKFNPYGVLIYFSLSSLSPSVFSSLSLSVSQSLRLLLNIIE